MRPRDENDHSDNILETSRRISTVNPSLKIRHRVRMRRQIEQARQLETSSAGCSRRAAPGLPFRVKDLMTYKTRRRLAPSRVCVRAIRADRRGRSSRSS